VYEFIPLVGGVVIALLIQSLATAKLRLVALVLLSTVCGAVATIISGEIFVNPVAYLVFDVGQVLLAAGATMLLVAWLRRWRTPPLQ
jgi:hypothetical protein